VRDLSRDILRYYFTINSDGSAGRRRNRSGTRVGSFTLIHAGAIMAPVAPSVALQYLPLRDRQQRVHPDCVSYHPRHEDRRRRLHRSGVVTLNDTFQDDELRGPVIMKGHDRRWKRDHAGIVIGENAVVGAGSVVVRDIASGGVSFGTRRGRAFAGPAMIKRQPEHRHNHDWPLRACRKSTVGHSRRARPLPLARRSGQGCLLIDKCDRCGF